VVSCTPRLITSAIQARQLGRDIMMWLGKECNVDKLLPEGMVKPEVRKNARRSKCWRCWNTGWSMEISALYQKTARRNNVTHARTSVNGAKGKALGWLHCGAVD
jgi:hypothetical protein